MKDILPIILVVIFSILTIINFFLNRRSIKKLENKVQFLLDEQGEIYELIDEVKEKDEETRHLVEVAHMKCDILANSKDPFPLTKTKLMN